MSEPSPRSGHHRSESSSRRATTPDAGTVEAQKQRIHDYLRGLHATHLLSFAHETGAFQQFHNAEPHGLNVDELAGNMGWVPGYARWFVEAAFALGILDLASEAGVTERSRYRFAPHMEDILADETSRHYLGEHARLGVLTARDYELWPDLYRNGSTYPWAMHSEAFLQRAATATRGLPGEWMQELLPRLPELYGRMKAGAHVLDVGCGAGWALVRMAETFPKCRVIGVDAEPNAVDMARTLIVFRSLQRRADVRLVRGEALEYEAEFDVVTMFLVLHTIPEQNRRSALEHIHGALKQDGLLVVLEDPYPQTPEDFRRPDRTGTVVAQWTEGPWGHRFDTPTQIQDLLQESGFKMVESHDAGRHAVFVAAKTDRP